MKRDYLRLLPVALIGFAVIFGGCNKHISIEKDAPINAAPPGADASKDKKGDVSVPDLKPAQEAVSSEDIASKSSGAKGGVHYSPLSPNDELTRSAEEKGQLYTVHFDFDNYSIRDDDKGLLDKNAKWLKLNSGVKVRIEGNADERGDSEYNLALGEKRARSVEKYLEDLGIGKARLSTISYGEEKPVDQGHDDTAWARNRRADFSIVN